MPSMFRMAVAVVMWVTVRFVFGEAMAAKAIDKMLVVVMSELDDSKKKEGRYRDGEVL